MILAALYLLWAYQRVFHGPATDENGSPSMKLDRGARDGSR